MNAPRDPRTDAIQSHVEAAWHLRQQGRLRDALLACDAALGIDPACVEAWLERGFTFASGGSMGSAADCYREALRHDPANPHAHAGLASIAARDGDQVAGRAHAKAALAADPANAIAAAALATIEIEAGNPAEARALVEPLVAARTEPDADRALLAGLLGDACNRIGDAAAAYAAYSLAKQDFAAIHGHRFAGRPPHRDFIAALTAQIPVMETSSWNASAAGLSTRAAARHLFVLGYPRSGNTLVENILASLPDVVALEERPTLHAADRDFLVDEGGLVAFSRAAEAGLDPYRAAYWDKVAEAGCEVTGRTFVDMDPLKGLRLPLIARLFPDARVVLMRRDPRDVVWSCFHTNFALTNAALDFTTLEGAARHYDAAMTLIEAAREHLPLNLHVLDYNRLVADFEAETRKLCAFIGLDWSADLTRFDRTAARRGVATASAGQVRKGLYDGTRQWERYAEWIEPVMPILAPWVEKFGYA